MGVANIKIRTHFFLMLFLPHTPTQYFPQAAMLVSLHTVYLLYTHTHTHTSSTHPPDPTITCHVIYTTHKGNILYTSPYRLGTLCD